MWRKEWDEVGDLLLRVAHKNVGNSHSEHLFASTHFGTKTLVTNFHTEVVEALKQYANADCIPLSKRMKYCKRWPILMGPQPCAYQVVEVMELIVL